MEVPYNLKHAETRQIHCKLTSRMVTLDFDVVEARSEGVTFDRKETLRTCRDQQSACNPMCMCISPRHPFRLDPRTGNVYSEF